MNMEEKNEIKQKEKLNQKKQLEEYIQLQRKKFLKEKEKEDQELALKLQQELNNKNKFEKNVIDTSHNNFLTDEEIALQLQKEEEEAYQRDMDRDNILMSNENSERENNRERFYPSIPFIEDNDSDIMPVIIYLKMFYLLINYS